MDLLILLFSAAFAYITYIRYKYSQHPVLIHPQSIIFPRRPEGEKQGG
jgi:hypothetical protein